MSRTDDVYKPALTSKNIPILTLDHKWHRLFTQFEPDDRIKKGEEELNKLLMRQGRLTNDVKNIRRLKKKLMDEIVGYAEELEHGRNSASRQLEDNRRLITDCNEKIEAYQEELMDLPKQINQVNYELMLLTMEICYQRIKDNTAEIQEIGAWITEIRIELKKKLIRKQEKEIITNEMYTYMHQIFGADVIEIFDMKYIPEMKKTSLTSPKTKAQESDRENKESDKIKQKGKKDKTENIAKTDLPVKQLDLPGQEKTTAYPEPSFTDAESADSGNKDS